MNASRLRGLDEVDGGRLRIGFISDSDCAPLVVAHESGLFQKYGLQVELRRETRWASIRDKVINGELDAAHAPATLPFITNLGIESDPCACVAGVVLSLQGNAILLSRELCDDGVRDAAGLRELIYRKWGRRTYTLGVVFPHSPAYFLLRDWLKLGGILPGIEVRIVVVPPAQLFPMLKLGYIDGFCGGEPWASLAAEAGAGEFITTSAELAPLHPEKVLMVRHDFARDRAAEHERVIAALLEACAFCDQPSNFPLLSETLSLPQYVNAPAGCLQNGFCGTMLSPGTAMSVSSGLNLFSRLNANDPSDCKAAWLVERLYELMEENVLKTAALRRAPVLKNIFRRDVYERARGIQHFQEQSVRVEAQRLSAPA